MGIFTSNSFITINRGRHHRGLGINTYQVSNRIEVNDLIHLIPRQQVNPDKTSENCLVDRYGWEKKWNYKKKEQIIGNCGNKTLVTALHLLMAKRLDCKYQLNTKSHLTITTPFYRMWKIYYKEQELKDIIIDLRNIERGIKDSYSEAILNMFKKAMDSIILKNKQNHFSNSLWSECKQFYDKFFTSNHD